MLKNQVVIRAQKIMLGISVVLLVAKFIAFGVTQSNSILSDALESIVNVLAASLGLYGLYLSQLPPDENHPNGHGKIEFIAAGFEGSLISIAGLSIIAKSIYNLLVPNQIESLDIGLTIVVGAGLVNWIMGKWLIRKGQKEKSIVLESSGKHLMTDAWSTIGITLGLGLYLLTDWIWVDQVTAMIFGVLIIKEGIHIIRKAVGGIMDEADVELVEQMVALLSKERSDKWIDIHNLRVIKYGKTPHVDLHVTMPYYFDLVEVHSEVEKLDLILKQNFGNESESFVHVDPCRSSQCSICRIESCTVRKAPFEKKIEWNVENITTNRKHRLID